MRRPTTSDPLTINVIQNDLGILPEWFIDGNSTYRAVYAEQVGYCPKQITTILGAEFAYIHITHDSDRTLTINTMITDTTPLEAELLDEFVELKFTDFFTQTAAVPEP